MRFGLAALALVFAPGLGRALVLMRTVEGGTRGGLLTSLGLEVGTLVHTLAAALGLSAILATPAISDTVVKYAGALYLVVLVALVLWRAPAVGPCRRGRRPGCDRPGSRLVLHAAMTGVLKPRLCAITAGDGTIRLSGFRVRERSKEGPL